MGSELETRRNDRIFLFNILKAQKENDWAQVVSTIKAGMEQDDVKVVLQEFEEWQKTKSKTL